MTKRIVPYLFLALLCGILLFIIGVRYGQRVELTNKTVNYLISIPPTPTTSPTTTPLSFSDYTHPGCKVSFLIPSTLEKTSESSSSAVFSTQKRTLGIAISCEKKPFVMNNKELSVNLNKTIRAYETKTADTISYRFYHTNTTLVVTITTLKQYLPLLQRSIAITQ